jgi:DNA-binding transcriptional ArsR family regulator
LLVELRVLRHSIELCLEFISITRRTVSEDLTESLLFAATLNANTSHLDAHIESSRSWAMFTPDFPPGQRRPIRISRLSDSLGIPRQTARMKANSLSATGWAMMINHGLVIRSDGFLFEPGMAGLGAYLGSAKRFVIRAADDGVCGLLPGESLVEPPFRAGWLVLRLSTNHVLQTLYALRTALGCGSLTTDFVLLGMIHETGSEDGDKRSISASELARRLELPRETVRRHIITLERQERIGRHAGGFLLNPDLTSSTALLAAASGLRNGLSRAVRRLRDCDALGPALVP